MTQFARPTLNAAVDDGITLSTKLNGAFPALYTNHAGAAAPPAPEKGQMWLDTSAEGATPPVLTLKQHTGTVWNVVGTMNLTTGLFTTAGGLPSSGGAVTGPIRFPSGTAAAPSITFDGDLDTGMWRVSADTIGFSTAGVQRISLNAANMTIDTTTITQNAASPTLVLNRATGASGQSTLRFQSAGSNRWGWQVTGAESTGNAGSGLFLQMFDDAGAVIVNMLQFVRATRQMGINGAQIGTAPLTVRTTAAAAAEDALELMNVNTDLNGSVGLNFRTAGGGLRGAIRGVRPGNNNGDIQIHTANSGALNLAATFLTNGDLDVVGKVETPNARLNDGSGRGIYVKSSWTSGTAKGITFCEGDPGGFPNMRVEAVHDPGNYATLRLAVSNALMLEWRNDATLRRSNDGASVAWQPVSDARLKENIAPTSHDALASLLAIEVVQFDYKADVSASAPKGGKHVSAGFVAQQVDQHVPDAVRVMSGVPTALAPSADADGAPAPTTAAVEDMHSVDNLALVPYLVRAIQQQQKQIDDLKKALAGGNA